jgi:hypothetical protein
MGFLKDLSNVAGKVVGGVVGGGLEAAGTAAGSNFVKEVGQGVYKTTVKSAEMAGSLADSVVTTVYGVATNDADKVKNGLSEAGGVVKTTATGVGRTLAHTAKNASQIVKGVLNDDLEMAGQGARELAKTVAISSLSIGFCEMVFDVFDEPFVAAEMVSETIISAGEIVDVPVASEVLDETIIATDEIADQTDVLSLDDAPEEETDVHWVEPHLVKGYYTSEGTYIQDYWRDGDGNISVSLSSDQGGGYLRHNPSV